MAKSDLLRIFICKCPLHIVAMSNNGQLQVVSVMEHYYCHHLALVSWLNADTSIQLISEKPDTVRRNIPSSDPHDGKRRCLIGGRK
ncbi:hypothetical protein UPYG_G00067860 [Umbra pygmaea]|uniref:Uncharacterized protein n=1 Tax=Umbra pygmaea TaxID=75934 RepID=A0ABD0XB44_UMBPY